MKTYTLETYYGEVAEVYLRINHYKNNGVLAIQLVDAESEEDYAVITVNIDYFLSDIYDEKLSFVDTNNCPWAEKFIKDNELGQKTGHYGFSGMCAYPEYRFDIDKIRKGL